MYIATLCIYGFLLLFISCNMVIKQKVPYFIVCTVIITAICMRTYFYQPSVTDDLSRLNIWVQEIKTNTVSMETIKNAQLDILWLEKLYFKFITLFNFYNALPIISIALEMIIIFTVYKKMALEMNLNTKFLMMALLFFLLTWDYFAAASGIRYFLVCAPLLAVLYFDLVKKKNIILCYVLYITLCFFHIGVSLVLIIRTICFICKSNKMKGFVCIILASHYILLDKLIWLIKFLPLGNLKAVISIKIESMIWKMQAMPFLKRLIFKVPLSVALIIMLIIFFKYYQEHYMRYRHYVSFLEILLMFSIGALYYPDMYGRMASFCYLAFIPIYWIMYMESKNRCENDSRFQRLYTQLSVYLVNICLALSFGYLIIIQYARMSN